MLMLAVQVDIANKLDNLSFLETLSLEKIRREVQSTIASRCPTDNSSLYSEHFT